jgi:hypothetical protein
MRPGWKRVAERAHNRNFESSQIQEALLPALAKDCRIELSDRFISEFYGVYGSLLKDDLPNQLEGLRSIAGAGLGRTVLDYAVQLAAGGQTGADAAEKALCNALTDRAARSARQVEEHYRRALKNHSTLDVRGRIEKSITGIEGLARQVLKIEPKTAKRTPTKHQGLDDGVSL